jgi:hypothetical protein
VAVYTFRGTTFEVERSDIWVSSPPPAETLESRRPIPFSGGEVIVDDGGEGLRVWNVTILVLPAAKTAMEANRRQTGSLVTPDGTYANSKLSQLREARPTLDRARWAYSAEFIVST